MMPTGSVLVVDDSRLMLEILGRVLGLFSRTPAQFFGELSDSPETKTVDPAQVEKMIEQRILAREKKDWARADSIRDQLKEMGVILEDGPQGTTWRQDV